VLAVRAGKMSGGKQIFNLDTVRKKEKKVTDIYDDILCKQ